jgi:hypothetical protein
MPTSVPNGKGLAPRATESTGSEPNVAATTSNSHAKPGERLLKSLIDPWPRLSLIKVRSWIPIHDLEDD